MKQYYGLIVLIALLTHLPATANEASDDPVRCFPAQSLRSFFKKFDNIKTEKRDTLHAVMDMKFRTDDNYRPPERFFIKDGTIELDLTIAPDGKITDFDKLASVSKEAKLCGEDHNRNDNTRFGLSGGADISFKNTSGRYSLAELTDGVKDGKSWYKKLFSGPMSIFVPKMTHIMIVPEDKQSRLSITVTKDGSPTELPAIEHFGGGQVIALKDLEISGMKHLNVTGGIHKIMPVPSVKKMKSLGLSGN